MSADAPSPNSTYLPCRPDSWINLTRSYDLDPVNYWDCGRQYGQYYGRKNASVNLKPTSMYVLIVFILCIGKAFE